MIMSSFSIHKFVGYDYDRLCDSGAHLKAGTGPQMFNQVKPIFFVHIIGNYALNAKKHKISGQKKFKIKSFQLIDHFQIHY